MVVAGRADIVTSFEAGLDLREELARESESIEGSLVRIRAEMISRASGGSDLEISGM